MDVNQKFITFIFKVIHQALDTLPWQSFIPSLTDLEQMVRVVGQFLPEVHSFLVSLFVRCSLSSLIVQCKSQPTNCARLLACLLHLHVRLAGEPTAQQVPIAIIKSPSMLFQLMIFLKRIP